MGKKVTYGLLLVGLIAGVAAAFSYQFAMDYTSTDEFCLSCHNHQIPYEELQATAHFKNAMGVSASCADCHVPHAFAPKLIRKMQAAKEVYGHFTGVIDSDEKYLAHREAMKQSEIARLKANDSAECRTCHTVERMDFEAQSRTARDKHLNESQGKTCIDCHAGIAHSPMEEEGFDF